MKLHFEFYPALVVGIVYEDRDLMIMLGCFLIMLSFPRKKENKSSL